MGRTTVSASKTGENNGYDVHTYCSITFTKTGITFAFSGDATGPYLTVSGHSLLFGK